jgi:hypothetical protein
MNGIYYKEGIYVLIDNDTNNDICIYHYDYKSNISLYGHRVQIRRYHHETATLTIDGISIVKYDYSQQSNYTSNYISDALPISIIVSHLNSIATNGVDAFLENYKKSIEFLYGELKELNQKTESQLSIEQEDSKIKKLISELDKIRTLLFSVLAILFSLYTYMSAGLENEKVISVYQSVIDTLA